MGLYGRNPCWMHKVALVCDMSPQFSANPPITETVPSHAFQNEVCEFHTSVSLQTHICVFKVCGHLGGSVSGVGSA